MSIILREYGKVYVLLRTHYNNVGGEDMKQEYKPYYEKFGLNVVYYRKRKRLTQMKLAELVEIDRSHISAIELGKGIECVDRSGRGKFARHRFCFLFFDVRLPCFFLPDTSHLLGFFASLGRCEVSRGIPRPALENLFAIGIRPKQALNLKDTIFFPFVFS